MASDEKCGFVLGDYRCMGAPGHRGRHKYRLSPLGHEERRPAHGRRTFFTVSVPFADGSVGDLTLPAPLTRADVRLLAEFSDYLFTVLDDEAKP